MTDKITIERETLERLVRWNARLATADRTS